MSNQKRLSQVSLAAVALLAAALPCLAQKESSKDRNLTVQPTEIATIRQARIGVPKAQLKTTADVAAAASTASRDKFNKAIAQAISSSSGFMSNATISESDWLKTQRLSNRSESTSSKDITFVPSRGQKLPD